MKKYFLFLLAIVALCSLIIFMVGGTETEMNMRWQILAYFSVLTLIFHYGLVKSSAGKPQNFIRYYMAATTFKLLIHLGVILIFSMTHRLMAIPFIISFIVAYAIYTAFEVFTAMKQRNG